MATLDCDVVVVGLGNAAQAAAASAHEAGAKVIVLEKAPEKKRGGNTWFSHGAQFRHYHNGIPDVKPLLPHVPESEWEKIDLPPYTKDDFYADIMRVTRGRSVPELAELLVNESYPTVRWMRESGIQWEILYTDAKPEGGRFRWHHGSSFIHSKDGGAGLVDMWHRILQSKGIEVRYENGAVRFITDEKNAVRGVVVQTPEGLAEIRCKGRIVAADRAGCDLIVAQGIEAGGHVRGKIGLLALLGQVLPAVRVPVVAAGGIGTGRAMAAALASGASAVRVGTRFVAAEESDAHPSYVKKLISAEAKDTVLTEAFSANWPNAPHRVLRSSLEAAQKLQGDVVGERAYAWEPNVRVPVPRFTSLVPLKTHTGEIDAMPHWAGESVEGVTKIQPARDIVRELAGEAEELLRRWSAPSGNGRRPNHP